MAVVNQIPHLRVVIAVSVFVLTGFAVVSAYVLGWTNDEVTKGNVIGTWVNFAMMSVGFWLGSSSSGKAKSDEPVDTRITNAPTDPAPTTSMPEPQFGQEPRP